MRRGSSGGRTASPNVLGDPAGRVASPPTSWPTPGEAADQTVWLCGLPGMKFILTSDHSGSRHQQPRARSPRSLRRPRKGPSPSAQARGSERAGGPASCCPAQGPQTRCAKGQAPRHPRSLPSDLALPLRRGNSHGPRAREWGQRVLIKLYLHRQAVGQICPAGWGVSSWPARARPTCGSGKGAGPEGGHHPSRAEEGSPRPRQGVEHRTSGVPVPRSGSLPASGSSSGAKPGRSQGRWSGRVKNRGPGSCPGTRNLNPGPRDLRLGARLLRTPCPPAAA